MYPKVDGNPEFPRPLNKSIGYSIAGLVSKGFVEIIPYSPELPIGGYAITASGAERLEVVAQDQ